MIFPNYKPIYYNNNSDISYDILNIHFKNYKINLKKYTKSLEQREKVFKKEGGKIHKFNYYDNNHFENFNEEISLIKEDIINWFFNLSLEERIKIATIENKTAVDVFHQMNNYMNYEKNASFAFKQVDFYEENSILKKSERDNFFYSSNIFNTSSFIDNSFDNSMDRALTEGSLNNYFIYKSQENKYEDNLLFFRSLLCENIFIFSVHSDLDSISLSPKLLEDKKEFLKYFNYFSYDKSFTDLIEIYVNNKNKNNYFSIPKWIGNEFFPSVAIILALIEQVIIIKFILNFRKNIDNLHYDVVNNDTEINFPDNDININYTYLNNNNFVKDSVENSTNNNYFNETFNNSYRNSTKNSKLIFSLLNEAKLNEFFERRKNLIFFLSDNYPKKIKFEHLEYHDMNNKNTQNYFDNMEQVITNIKDPEYLINSINIPLILNNINSNKQINDFIHLKNKQMEKGYRNFSLNRYNNTFNINFKNLKMFIIGKDEFETEKNYLSKYKEDIILFFDYLIFYNIELIWKKEYFLSKDIFIKIYNLYTEKNALDLINEMEKNIDNITNINSNCNGKKNKNNKKNGNGNNNLNKNNNKKFVDHNNSNLNNNINMYTKTNINNNIIVINTFSDNIKKENINFYKPYLINNTFFKVTELNDPLLLLKSENSKYYKDHIMTKDVSLPPIKNGKNNNYLKSKSNSKEKNIKKQEKNKRLIIKNMIKYLIDTSVDLSLNKSNNEVFSIIKTKNKNKSKSIKQKFLENMENRQKEFNLEILDKDNNNKNNIDSFDDLVDYEINNNSKIPQKTTNSISNIKKEKVKVKIIKNYFACSEDLLIAEKNTKKKMANIINLDEDINEEDNLNTHFYKDKRNINKFQKNLIENNIEKSCVENLNMRNSKHGNVDIIQTFEDEYFKNENSDSPKKDQDINLERNNIILTDKKECILKGVDKSFSLIKTEDNNSDKNKKKKKLKQQTFYQISSKKSYQKTSKQQCNSNDISKKNEIISKEINLNDKLNHNLHLDKIDQTKTVNYDNKDKNDNKNIKRNNFDESNYTKKNINEKSNNNLKKSNNYITQNNNHINNEKNKLNIVNQQTKSSFRSNDNKEILKHSDMNIINNNNFYCNSISKKQSNSKKKSFYSQDIENKINISSNNNNYINTQNNYLIDQSKNDRYNKNQKNFNTNKNIKINNINLCNNPNKSYSFNYRENDNLQNNNSINYSITNKNYKNGNENNLACKNEDNSNLSYRKNSINNSSQFSNNSYSQLKSNNIQNNSNSPMIKHKNSFNCKDNRNSLDIEFVLNNMNSNNLNQQNFNNNYTNQNINININNNTNFFNFNFEGGNQFFSEYEKIPRKRSHNISNNFSNGILEQIGNSGNSFKPNLNMNLNFNNFFNNNNIIYGKIIENIKNINNIGLTSRFDLPNFNHFTNFSPHYNFNTANPIIDFNNNIKNSVNFNNGNTNFGFFNNINNANLNSFNNGINFNNFNNNNLKNSFNNNTNINPYINKINTFNQDYVPFTCKLHNDILDYLNDVNKVVDILKPIKLNVVGNLEKMLKEFLDFEITIDVFGSFASDLSIESSDIDLKVNILNENSNFIDYDYIIFSLVKFFNEKNVFDSVFPIHTASIPIIKLVFFYNFLFYYLIFIF